MDKNSIVSDVLDQVNAVQPKLKKKSNKNKKQINKSETTTANGMAHVTKKELTANGLGLRSGEVSNNHSLSGMFDQQLHINQQGDKLNKDKLNGLQTNLSSSCSSTSNTSKKPVILNGHHHHHEKPCALNVEVAGKKKINGISYIPTPATPSDVTDKQNESNKLSNKGTKHCHIKQASNVLEQLIVEEAHHHIQKQQQQKMHLQSKSGICLENGFSHNSVASGLVMPTKAIDEPANGNVVGQMITSVANFTAAIDCATDAAATSSCNSETATTPTISNTAKRTHDAVAPADQITDTGTISTVVATQSLDLANVHIEYREYESELQMHDIMSLIQAELSEPYSIYTYRYFIYNWPKLCFLAAHGSEYVGAIVCKLDMHMNVRRGYIAMLAVRKEYRKLKIGTTLVQKAIEAMLADHADEVVLETEMSNFPALRLYENLGFVRDKRLFRYYLNGVDALRLKLWFR